MVFFFLSFTFPTNHKPKIIKFSQIIQNNVIFLIIYYYNLIYYMFLLYLLFLSLFQLKHLYNHYTYLEWYYYCRTVYTKYIFSYSNGIFFREGIAYFTKTMLNFILHPLQLHGFVVEKSRCWTCLFYSPDFSPRENVMKPKTWRRKSRTTDQLEYHIRMGQRSPPKAPASSPLIKYTWITFENHCILFLFTFSLHVHILGMQMIWYS